MAKLRLSYPAFRVPAVVSGSGALRTLADMPSFPEAVFMLSGQPSVQAAVAASLGKAGINLSPDRVCTKPAGEPSVESIETGAAFLRSRSAPAIVAIGGGSVLDWARLSWALSVGALDLDAGTVGASAKESRPAFYLVPTTCASGAEGATVAVYLRHGHKQPVVSPEFLADRVVLDGRFLSSLDEVSFSDSVADALTHAVESILSIVPNGLAKMAAAASLRTLLDLAAGGVPSASRADRLLEASFLAGVAASHTSVGISHAFAHAMAAEGLGHGRGNAVAVVPAVRFNEDADTMANLLGAAGLSHAELIERMRTIVGTSRRAGSSVVASALADAARRAALCGRMLGDTTLRSNPVAADASGVDRFLNLISAELAA